MRHLAYTVVAGGVIYPAGTPATPELLALIADRHWAGTEPTEPTEPRPAPARNDPKADWVAAAVEHGLSPEEAEAMTKAELVELLG